MREEKEEEEDKSTVFPCLQPPYIRIHVCGS